MSLESDFGRQKAYGTPVTSRTKPANGKLVLIKKGGHHETLMEDKPFALLNSERTRLIVNEGYRREQLKIKYL